MPDHSATVVIGIGPDFTHSINHLELPAPAGGEVTLLPSSLQRRDHTSAVLRHYLRERSVRSHLMLPESVTGAIFRRTPFASASPSGQEHEIRLPSRLVEADPVWAVVDIDAVSGRGPYVLDLLVRYTGPATRLRLLGSSQRANRAVHLLRWRPIELAVITREFPGFTLAAWSADPIAAELIALALVDEDLTRDHELSGPWEDELVQAATEHELGVRLPAEVVLEVRGERHGPVNDVLQRLSARIGVTIT